MLRNVLDFYIEQTANGDELYRQKLINRLAERLLFVPFRRVVASLDSKNNAPNQEAIVLLENSGLMVPVFTSEKFARNWIDENYPRAGLASRIGRDVSAELSSEQGLLINPGQEFSVSLNPQEAKILERSAPETDDDFADSMLPEVNEGKMESIPLVFTAQPFITLLSKAV